ncbi:MAG: hypothetical protein ABI622_06380 [Chloroflexota bacterium]
MTDPTAPASADPPARPNRPADASGATMLGVLLVVLGGLFLLAQQTGFDLGDIRWPFWVIVPGMVLLAAGLVVPGGSGMIIGGSVVTTVGLVLLYQDATDHWESWAYAWALVGPAASGIGTLLAGLRTGNGSMVRAGATSAMVGLGLFAAGYLFFEGILNISGRQLPLPGWAVPVVVIGLGLALVLRGIGERRST